MTSEEQWSIAEDGRVRSALAALRDDVAAAPLPEPAFIRGRGDLRRRRRVLAAGAGVAAAAVVIAAIGFGITGRGNDDAQPAPVPATRSSAPPTDASPSPTTTGTAGYAAFLGIVAPLPVAQEWRALRGGGPRTPVVQAQPSHEMAGLGCLTPTAAALREDERVVGDPANPDASLLGTQNRWSFATPARARAAHLAMAGQLRTQCHLPGLAETTSGDVVGTRLWAYDGPDGTHRIALVTAGRDVAVVEAVPADGPVSEAAFAAFATTIRERLLRYGSTEEPVVVGPSGSTPAASLFVPVSAWTDALGREVSSGTGELDGTSDVAQCDADGALFRAADGTASGTFGIAQIRVPAGFVGRQRVRRIDAASAPEAAASINAYLASVRSGFLAGCAFPNGEVTAEAGPTDGLIKARTTFADGSPSLTTYLGVGPLGTEGYVTTIALFNLGDVTDAGAFAAVQDLLDVAARQ